MATEGARFEVPHETGDTKWEMGNKEQGKKMVIGLGLGKDWDWELIVITLESHIGGYKNVDSVTGGTRRCGEEGRVESRGMEWGEWG